MLEKSWMMQMSIKSMYILLIILHQIIGRVLIRHESKHMFNCCNIASVQSRQTFLCTCRVKYPWHNGAKIFLNLHIMIFIHRGSKSLTCLKEQIKTHEKSLFSIYIFRAENYKFRPDWWWRTEFRKSQSKRGIS